MLCHIKKELKHVIYHAIQTDTTRFVLQYLLAMVFAYFKRAGLSTNEFTRINFFVAL